MIKQVFYWLLNKGVLVAALLINVISFVVLAIVLFILNWYHKNH